MPDQSMKYPHDRPICPKCSGKMWLKMSVDTQPYQQTRDYRCPACGTVVAIPVEDLKRTG
jgi:hypothetical protein